MASEAGTRRVAINIDTYVCLYALYVIFSVIHVDEEEEEANGGRLERLTVVATVDLGRQCGLPTSLDIICHIVYIGLASMSRIFEVVGYWGYRMN